jgi:hypothetical protein
MIKVEKIQIREFRGIRNLTLRLKGNNYAVCGPNGTGKSGVVDALEFALTGNISRLSGEGMGNVTVKEHAPHVDSRDFPEKACVVVTLKIPSLENKEVVLERTVKDFSNPKISPSSPEILSVLNQFNGHPEFVLSRREIIRYVIATPGNRSEEIQALLRLNQVEVLRKNLVKISNASEKEKKDFERVKKQAAENLAQALEITEINKDKILEAVNARRSILSLDPLTDLTATTTLNDGLASGGGVNTAPKLNKISAMAELKRYSEEARELTANSFKEECVKLKDQLSKLNNNPIVTESISREKLLRDSVDFIASGICPVCDTKWDIATLKSIVDAKLKEFEKISESRSELEKKLEPVISLIERFSNSVLQIEQSAIIISPENAKVLSTFRTTLADKRKFLNDFLPIPKAISALIDLDSIPPNVTESIEVVGKSIQAFPEPNQRDAARDFIVRAQDRFETFHKAAREAEKAKRRSELARKICEVYTNVSNSTLENVYKDVEKKFSKLYRSLNSEDEGNFTAKLEPSLGKLGFDVDFYGRGHFPPGAYHSEGHQDAMGLCLYLALMCKLQGKNFRFAVLDDVLMSVDVGHRREVCNLLKKNFPETQLVLTTHDEVWLKLMATSGLITSDNSIRFSNWTPDHGPTEWRTRDVWTEIDNALKANNVRVAAGVLRYYLEHIARELCDSLKAKIEFRGDGRYDLGDTLPPAVHQLRHLIIKGANAADLWKKTDESKAIREQEKKLGESFSATDAEQWQINPAIHYNEWANFSPKDFIPVVQAFRELLEQFSCGDKDGCRGLLYLSFTGKQPDSLRCACGSININLKKPDKED